MIIIGELKFYNEAGRIAPIAKKTEMSDRGLPIGVCHINGYGIHTYSFINAKNERFWVKYHFKTLQGHKHWTNAEAAIDAGVMELNRNPDNYFAEVEQAAFSPSNIAPGISFSPDKMLQARVFSYADAHRPRLGTHYEALPVNAPRCPVAHYHKDGQMRFFPNNPNPDAFYEPNSLRCIQRQRAFCFIRIGVLQKIDHLAG